MTVHPTRMQQNFDRAAKSYDANAELQRTHMRWVLGAALSHLPKSAGIVDIGCGTGSLAKEARAQRPDWYFAGIDYSFEMLRQAQERMQVVIQGDAMRLPLADNCADAVLSSLCMQWVPDKRVMMSEIRRVLRPGGVAILGSLASDTLSELRNLTNRMQIPLGLLKMWSYAEYRQLAIDSGMQVMVCRHLVETRYYRNVETLLNSVRSIGAGNASDGDVAYIGPKQFSRLIQQYESDYGAAFGVSATWEPVFMMLKKR